MKSDLHSHTTASDGADSPSHLVAKAIAEDIKVLAITDHDTTDGLAEAERASLGQDILLIKGVEIEIKFPKGEFHLLGLNLQKNWPVLNNRLAYLQAKRNQRNLEMVGKMRAMGIEADYKDIVALGSGVIGRPHFAKYLIKIGKAKSQKMAFDKYLGFGRPLFLPKEGLELDEAISLIHNSGGYAVLAHPPSLYISINKIYDYLKDFKERGLDGLEVYHPQIKLSESNRLIEMAKNLDLQITGGSDYHGETRKDRELGYAAKRFILPVNLPMWLLNEEQKLFYHKITTCVP